jgi:hypothetical protein
MVSIIVFPRAIIIHHLEYLHHVRLSLALYGNGSNMRVHFNNCFSRKWPGWDDGSVPGDTPWECLWSVIKDFKSLHTLTVTLEASGPHWHKTPHWARSIAAGAEMLLFNPMKQVTCNDFLLRVNWTPAESILNECPFRIECFTEEAET